MAVKIYRGTGMASAESSEASPEASNVEKTREDTLAEYTKASPEAKNVEKIHETHWWQF